jgi:hypothetical protein
MQTCCNGKISSSEIQWQILHIATPCTVQFDHSYCTKIVAIYWICHGISFEETLPLQDVFMHNTIISVTALQYNNFNITL